MEKARADLKKAALNPMNAVQLKDLCKRNGVETKGTRDELLRRLLCSPPLPPSLPPFPTVAKAHLPPGSPDSPLPDVRGPRQNG